MGMSRLKFRYLLANLEHLEGRVRKLCNPVKVDRAMRGVSRKFLRLGGART